MKILDEILLAINYFGRIGQLLEDEKMWREHALFMETVRNQECVWRPDQPLENRKVSINNGEYGIAVRTKAPLPVMPPVDEMAVNDPRCVPMNRPHEMFRELATQLKLLPDDFLVEMR